MKNTLRICLLLALLSGGNALYGLSMAYETLEQVVERSTLIVVGKFENIDDRSKSMIGGPKYQWVGDLTVTEVIKGAYDKPKLPARWMELGGEKDYEAGEVRIWLISTHKDINYVSTQHGSLPLDQLDAVKKIMSEQAATEATKKDAAPGEGEAKY